MLLNAGGSHALALWTPGLAGSKRATNPGRSRGRGSPRIRGSDWDSTVDTPVDPLGEAPEDLGGILPGLSAFIMFSKMFILILNQHFLSIS